MRWLPTLSLLIPLATSACFEDSSPPPQPSSGSSSSGGGCAPGTEGCACIEEACIGGLTCLSATCVDPSPTGGATDSSPVTVDGTSTSGDGESTSRGTTTPETTDASGPSDAGMDGGSLPSGALCDPIDDECGPGLACGFPEADGISCAPPGLGGPGTPCGIIECGAGLLCHMSAALDDCNAQSCCTNFCDASGPDDCPGPLACRPFYPPGTAPAGYGHVGVCLSPL